MKRLSVNGRRGAYLIVKGLFYILQGITYLFPNEHRQSALGWVTPVVSVSSLGVVWVLLGGIALATGLRKGPDQQGYAVLTFGPSLFAGLWFVSYVQGLAPEGLSVALLYLTLGGSSLVVSGMLNQPDGYQERHGQGAKR